MERRPATESVVACYREFEPHPALADRVRALFSFTPRFQSVSPTRRVTLELRFGEGDRYASPTFADANASLVFDLGVGVDRDGVWRDSLVPLRGRVLGPMRRVPAVGSSALPAMVGAYFRAGQLPGFARAPSTDLTDHIVALEDLWGANARVISEQLATLDEAARLDLLERELLRRVTTARQPTPGIDVTGIAATVSRQAGRTSVESLASAAGVSRQYLTRVFRERVGVTPKVYCRLARFQSALVYAREGAGVDWSRVAYDLGYADQSHMIAEFRRFSSLTPKMLATEPWFHPFIERAKARAAAESTSAGTPRRPRRGTETVTE